MPQKIASQKGMSMLGTLMLVMLVVGGMLLGMKLLPLYINDYAIGKAMTSLESEQHLYAKTKSELRNIIRRKLAADYTDDLADDAFEVIKNKGKLIINVNYETRVPLVYNLDIIANFSHHFEQNQ